MIRVWINDIEITNEQILRCKVELADEEIKTNGVLAEQYRNIEAKTSGVIFATRENVLSRVAPKIQAAISRTADEEW